MWFHRRIEVTIVRKGDSISITPPMSTEDDHGDKLPGFSVTDLGNGRCHVTALGLDQTLSLKADGEKAILALTGGKWKVSELVWKQ